MISKEHITPNIIESYCLGVLSPEQCKEVEGQAALHPDIKQSIDLFMQTLEQYMLANARQPAAYVKTKTLDLLDNLKREQDANINDLPVLNKYSDHSNWLRLVKPLLPEKLDEGMFVTELRKDKHISQTLIWTNVDYPDEVHTDVQESFIILKGRCRCHIEQEVVEMGPGHFMEIPLYKHHFVKVLEPVIAVVQHLKVA